jgi:hypothetical protein
MNRPAVFCVLSRRGLGAESGAKNPGDGGSPVFVAFIACPV